MKYVVTHGITRPAYMIALLIVGETNHTWLYYRVFRIFIAIIKKLNVQLLFRTNMIIYQARQRG
jgi:hypothetical protein